MAICSIPRISYPQIPWNPLVDDHILPYFTHKKAMESKMVCRRYLWILQQTSEISQLAMFGADPVATPVIRNVNIHQHVQYVYIYINQPTAVLSMINHWTIIIIKIDITMIDQ